MAALTKIEREWRRNLLDRGQKWCPRCRRILAVGAFAQNCQTTDGFQSYCRECYHDIYTASADERRAWQVAYGRQHAADIKRRNRAYYKEHREELIERQRLYYQKNLDACRERIRQYRETERGKLAYKTKIRRRRSRERGLPADLTTEEWARALEWFGNCCAYCGAASDELEQDHFIPVAKDGALTATNVVPACHVCNQSKRDAWPDEWTLSRRGAKRVMPTALQNIDAYFREVQCLSTAL